MPWRGGLSSGELELPGPAPEFWLFIEIVPGVSGTGEDGIFQHVDGCAELLPEGGFPESVHVLLLSTTIIFTDHESREREAMGRPNPGQLSWISCGGEL